MKIRPVGADLFHADRRKNGQTIAFRNFMNVPVNLEDVWERAGMA